MIARPNTRVEMIPIDRINILNERDRGKSKFRQIVDNIAHIGLKKPIVVARREMPDGQSQYDLACGQGRIEAYRALGQMKVPAIVIQATKEDLLLMSLAENVARRRHTSIELIREIEALVTRGYSLPDIARKADLDVSYVRGVIRLLKKGEEKLLKAVADGQIPLSIAITIASSDEEAVQKALAEAYESKNLRGKALLRARRLIESRRIRGKAINHTPRTPGANGVSAASILKTYNDETRRQRYLVQKARACETRLLFVVTAVRSLLKDGNFIAVLRAESLDAMPNYLAEQVEEVRS